MKKAYLGLLLTGICVAAFAGGVTVGFLKNKIREENAIPIEENIKAVSNEEETVSYEPAKEVVSYFVSSKGDYIILSEVLSDNTKNEIDRAEMNPSVLPIEDIELLREGLSFASKDEALMMIENFVS